MAPAGEIMAKKVVAIVGSYRKGGTVDGAVDAVLAGARERGAETSKIFLLDQHIEYCRNCRACTQTEGEARGECAIHDDMAAILDEIDRADALILGSPVNFYNVTAVFRTFLERLLGCAYWPWGQWSPKPRSEKLPRKAVLISSSAAPGIFLPFATGVPKALRVAANCLGARPVAKLWIGLVAQSAQPKLSERVLRRAHRIGAEL
jgi:putative NADPH-quinone reductase